MITGVVQASAEHEDSRGDDGRFAAKAGQRLRRFQHTGDGERQDDEDGNDVVAEPLGDK
jgi:hypothetical protein